MKCRFFLVEGEPGSPSAFRFIMDLREDWGEAEAAKNQVIKYTSNTSRDKCHFKMMAKQCVCVKCYLASEGFRVTGWLLCLHAGISLLLSNAMYQCDYRLCAWRWQDWQQEPTWTARSSGRLVPAWSRLQSATQLEHLGGGNKTPVFNQTYILRNIFHKVQLKLINH